MYNGPTWWVLCMNRPAVCVIQYTPSTGISSYNRGTYFNVFTASNSIHVELHHVYHNSAHYHNNTTLQYCTEGCLHNITAKQGVSEVTQRWSLPYSSNLYLWQYQAVFLSLLLWTSSYSSHLYLYLWLCFFSHSSNSTIEQLRQWSSALTRLTSTFPPVIFPPGGNMTWWPSSC